MSSHVPNRSAPNPGSAPSLADLTQTTPLLARLQKDIIHGSYYYPTGASRAHMALVCAASRAKLVICRAQHLIVLSSPCSHTTEPDGQGETCEQSRPLKDGETGEWILLDGVSLWACSLGDGRAGLTSTYPSTVL